MTDTGAATATATSATADPQDPLPESNWTWRRWTFVGSNIVLLGLMGAAIYFDRGWAMWPLTVCFVVIWIIYGIAPSGEQAVKMLAAVSAMKDGVSFRTASTATAPSGAKVTTTTTSGKAPEAAAAAVAKLPGEGEPPIPDGPAE